MNPVRKFKIQWEVLERGFIPLIFLLGLFFTFHFHGQKDRVKNVIWSDQEGYYVYLPAVFIYDGFVKIPVKNCCRIKEGTGEVDTKYTYGVSVFELPFFLGSHALAKVIYNPDHPETCHHDQFKPNGFSLVYAWGVMVCAVFWLSFGLYFLLKVLRRYYSIPISLLTCLVIFLGTNLFYYSIGEAGMSHVYSFAIFALVLWALPSWLEKGSWGKSILIGTALGLSVVIRPTNIIFASVLLGWEVYSWKDLKQRLQFLPGLWPKLILMAILALIIAFPQMLYWHHINGSWVSYSYQDEGFTYWNRPKLFQVWFSYQNGLFMYSPVMLLALAGLVPNLRKRVQSAPFVLVMFLLSSYIFGSWWAWWFGGAYGHRSFIEYFALLSLPLAASLKGLFSLKWKWTHYLVLGVIIWLMLAQMKMTHLYSPPWDGDSWTWDRFVNTWELALKFWKKWS
ncbi:MAG: hypothetical protein H6581_14395 [Bacteroidia bacterium]|nr:hypothetical protein [Bacteroidia bacterium]